MKTQLVLLVLTLVLFTLFNQNGQAMAFSYATTLNPNRGWAANLYERAKIWFDKSLEDVEKTFNEGIKDMKEQVKGWKEDFEKATDKKATKEELETLKKEWEDRAEKQQKHLDELQAAKDRIKDSQTEKKSLMQQIEEKATANDFVKNAWNLPAGHEKKGIEIDLKTVSINSTSYSLTGTNSFLLRGLEMEPGVAKDPTTPFFIRNLISVGATSENTVSWNERVMVEGGAGQVAEGATFPQWSGKWAKKFANTKKTAVYTKITEEMLEDVDFVLSEIQDELIDGPAGMNNQLENEILSGDGTGEHHTGILTQSTAFALPSGFETLAAPNNFDLIQAMALQIELANYMPTHVILGSSAFANMNLYKDTQGRYLIPPFVSATGMLIAGLQVIKTNRFGSDTVLVCNPQLVKFRIKRNLTLRFFEQNEDDALTDRTTITASLRGVLFVKTPDLKGLVKSTFSAGKNLIKTA
ncbi:phage major capsid protein [Spirosoma sp. HMF4905]|uniref:Phage major capsid protein n=1 Tax=Spirosoma arboris TaxID=2682092 RepID=A0A7K1SKS3_9BACT|nr:phage major capsid protein [Spirosoma arboris]MVM34400.1 phage major capsid protein [Spirosoma arboris]